MQLSRFRRFRCVAKSTNSNADWMLESSADGVAKKKMGIYHRIKAAAGSLLPIATLMLGLVMTLGLISRTHAGMLNYTLDGGTSTVTGTVGGISFSNAKIKLMATADSAGVVSGNSGVPYYQLPASVFLEITDGSSVYSMAMDSGFEISSVDYSGIPVPIESAINFSNSTAGFSIRNPKIGGLPSLYNDLSATGIWNGTNFVASLDTFTTSLGILQIVSFTDAGGTFTISPSGSSAVPEPTSMAIFGLSALGMAYRARRKAKA